MSRLERIRLEVSQLEGEELKAFLAMVDELKWQLWDRQIEADSEAGKLDWLVEEIEADIAAGRTRPL